MTAHEDHVCNQCLADWRKISKTLVRKLQITKVKVCSYIARYPAVGPLKALYTEGNVRTQIFSWKKCFVYVRHVFIS